MNWVEFGAGVAVKAWIPLVLGACVVLGMRRRAAAERHFVWSVAVVGALLVPVLYNAIVVAFVIYPEFSTWLPRARRGGGT